MRRRVRSPSIQSQKRVLRFFMTPTLLRKLQSFFRVLRQSPHPIQGDLRHRLRENWFAFSPGHNGRPFRYRLAPDFRLGVFPASGSSRKSACTATMNNWRPRSCPAGCEPVMPASMSGPMWATITASSRSMPGAAVRSWHRGGTPDFRYSPADRRPAGDCRQWLWRMFAPWMGERDGALHGSDFGWSRGCPAITPSGGRPARSVP